MGEKLLAIEKMAGLTDVTQEMRLLHADSAFTRVAEQIRLMEENSPITQLQKQMRLIGESSAMVRFSEQMRLAQEHSVMTRFSENMCLMEESSTFRRLAETLNATGELARAAMGPMWELRDAGLLGMTGRRSSKPFARRLKVSNLISGCPRSKKPRQITKLLQENAISGVAARWAQEASGIARAIERMNTPWLDIHDKLRSVTGFAEMQGIGAALRTCKGSTRACPRRYATFLATGATRLCGVRRCWNTSARGRHFTSAWASIRR